MQRLRVLLLGKGGKIIVENPSVQLEPEEDREVSGEETVEFLEREKFMEEEAVISQDITSHLNLHSSDDQISHMQMLEDLNSLGLAQQEIAAKIKSNSFQVSTFSTESKNTLH